uniref:Ig-like domain-containing protein n=1 Tax=Xenopus tropicalis TaxID=8364 RepID=A0A803K4S7_XENTR
LLYSLVHILFYAHPGIYIQKVSAATSLEHAGSVTLNCTFDAEHNTYSVTWFLGCENKSNLVDHPCYKHRVQFDNNKRQVTISNLTETDSGTYCCSVEVANGKRGAGNGTRVEVKQRQCKSGTVSLAGHTRVDYFFFKISVGQAPCFCPYTGR